MAHLFDFLIVGAGMTGLSAARTLAEAGAKVLVVEERGHLGGNCADAIDGNGILTHSYGPHIFHTSKLEVIQFLSRFTDWRDYEHRVCGLVGERLVPIPFNLDSLALCFPSKIAKAIQSKLVDEFSYGGEVPILELRSHNDAKVRDLGLYVYAKIFEGYTAKQWGLTPTQIDPEVTNRVPVRINHDDRYFKDTFQKMPNISFAAMFAAMADHPGLTIRLNTTFASLHDVMFGSCLYTGTIDGYFDHRLGKLPYRTLRFEWQHTNQIRHQPVAVVNYPNSNIPFTRITEYKHLTGQDAAGTSLSVEYADEHIPGQTIPYYPVFTAASRELYQSYVKLGDAEAPNTIFTGRLGAFRYFNMDDACAEGIFQAKVFINRGI